MPRASSVGGPETVAARPDGGSVVQPCASFQRRVSRSPRARDGGGCAVTGAGRSRRREPLALVAARPPSALRRSLDGNRAGECSGRFHPPRSREDPGDPLLPFRDGLQQFSFQTQAALNPLARSSCSRRQHPAKSCGQPCRATGSADNDMAMC